MAGDNRHLFVPLDHSVSDGPVAPAGQWDGLLRALVAGGADGIVVHKGRARALEPDILRGCALVVHLSASTACAADVDAKVLVGDVEEALALGADAVSVHVNIGSDTERQQLADLGAVARSCDTWGMPLITMVYPRGPRIENPRDPALLAHLVNVAADLGADMVKTSVALPIDRMAEVVAHSPIPVNGTLRPSVGRAPPGVVLRVHQGELDVALEESPYLFDTGGTQDADGWLHTRDRATTDGTGAVSVHGRADSLVVIGGLKVDLTEVERVLREHPAVEQAVLVHEGMTEAYVAVAEGAERPSAEELLRWCRERLADYKLPRVIRLLESLPRTSNGKLVRQAATLQAAATGGA